MNHVLLNINAAIGFKVLSLKSCWQRSWRWEQLRFVVPARCVFAVLQPMSSQRVSSSLILHFRVRKEEKDWGGGELWARDSWTNRGNRKREREGQEGGETLSFSLSVPRNLSKPIYLGPLALRALWVLSFSDRWKEMSCLGWNLKPTSCQRWTGLSERERAEVWIWFRLAIWLVGRHQKEQQTKVLTHPSVFVVGRNVKIETVEVILLLSFSIKSNNTKIFSERFKGPCWTPKFKKQT